MSALLILLTNSPGELSSWVFPISKIWTEKHPDSQIVVGLTPCQYASGKEAEVAATFPGVIRVLSPKETLKIAWGIQRFPVPFEQAVVCYLGGDPMYARRLGKQLNLPVAGYTEHDSPLKGFLHTFYRTRNFDLMSARVALSPVLNRETLLQKYHLKDRPYIVFFFGSRPQHFEAFFPLMLEVIQLLKKRNPNFYPIGVVSPFIGSETVGRLAGNSVGFPLVRGESLDWLTHADFLVTLPGTNTAEAMYLNVPMQVFIPLNRPDLLIFDGLLGLLGKLPALGLLLKHILIFVLKTKKRYYALPNRMLNREIVPEYVGVFSVQDIALRIQHWINRPKIVQEVQEDLQAEFKASPSAAVEIVDVLTNLYQKSRV